MKYIVEYRITKSGEIIQKEFDNIIKAMEYQRGILIKLKNKIDYCIYK